MTYIHIKKIGDKKYYSLRKTIRKNKKTHSKLVLSLGNDLKKIKIDKVQYPDKIIHKKLNYLKKIETEKKKTNKENKYLSKNQIIEINAIKKHYKNLHTSKKKRLLNIANAKFIQENISLDTNEKTSLTLEEINLILNKKISPKKKPITLIYKTINISQIITKLQQEKSKLNQKLIDKIPKSILHNIFAINGYRTEQCKNVPNIFSKAKEIQHQLQVLIQWYKKNNKKIHPIALASLFHNKFEKIHPFIATNGETGRILMNHILDLLNYPPIIISKKNKKEYIKTMNLAYKGLKKDLLNTDTKYYQPLIDFMQKQFVKTYYDNFF